MNIEFLVNKENERVVVSNQKGKLHTRDYQDNIKEIFTTEDVIEEYESDLSANKHAKQVYKDKIYDIDWEIRKTKKRGKRNIKRFLVSLIGLPFFGFFIAGLTGSISKGLLIGAFLQLATLISGAFWTLSPDFCYWGIKRLEKNKEKLEKLVEEADIEIKALVEVIARNKEELKRLLEEKTKENLQNMPEEAQTISYQEALKAQKAYLEQLKVGNEEKQRPKEEKNSVLGRFKRLKNR